MCVNVAFCATSQKKVQKAKENDPQYQYNLGLLYLNQNNVDEAMKYFNKSLSLNPNYHQAWNALGLAYSYKGDVEASVKAFEKCLALTPQFTEARNNLGMLYQELGYLDRAEAEFLKAAQDTGYKTRELPYFNLARLYFLQDRIEDAYENVQRAIQIKARFGMAHNLKGQIFEKRGNIAEAVAAYEQAVDIVPDDLLFNYNLAVAYFNANDDERAEKTFQKISALVTDLETKEKINEYLKIISQRK